MPNSNSELLTSDLNGDNTKDLIVTSLGLGYITIHPNIDGDYTATRFKLILGNQSEYPSSVSVMDIDNDGMLDIIACNRYSNKIYWFKNLGNFNFTSISTLININNGPNLLSVSDVDNDGINDLIVNLATDNKIVWLKNNGDGTFLNPQVIYNNSSSSVVKLMSKDLNNDSLPEIIIGYSSNSVHWLKNQGNGVFNPNLNLAYANSGKAFDFEDLNNDNYPDLIYASSGTLVKRLSILGDSFASLVSTNISAQFREIKFKDIDEDGLTDLVGSTGTNISYLKRLANGTFLNSILLINTPVESHFITDQLNNDSHLDFIIPSYTSNINKLSAFVRNSSSISYSEKLISFYNSAVKTVKIADVDNDGKNDIISAFKSIVWNKNTGGGNFTSYKKISNGYPIPQSFNNDIEVVDIDNDNDKDIVTVTQSALEVYYNDGSGNFTLGYNLTLPYQSLNIEVADLNGDSLKDIIVTFNISGSPGEICLAWIPNLTGNTYGSLTTIGLGSYGYFPYLIVSTDIDNDNDIDIISYSNYYSRLHTHINDGNGIFTTNWVSDVVSAVSIAVEDFDNDGDKDIFTGGGYYPGVYLIKNNDGIFANKSLIELKKADDLEFADLNNDGLKELIGTATENSDLGTLFYFLNNGTSFSNQVLINSENAYSLSRNIAIGDLNNDNKPDITNSFYYTSKVSYFLNSSTLSTSDLEFKDTFSFYPVPFTETLNWETPDVNSLFFNISIYNTEGKLVYSKKGISSPLNLNFLPKGIYVVNLTAGSKSYSKKIIKN